MGKYASEHELKQVAKAYCKKMGYEFIFANGQKFGFQDKNGNLWSITYHELYEILKNKKK